jgi:hypothetical protein
MRLQFSAPFVSDHLERCTGCQIEVVDHRRNITDEVSISILNIAILNYPYCTNRDSCGTLSKPSILGSCSWGEPSRGGACRSHNRQAYCWCELVAKPDNGDSQ